MKLMVFGYARHGKDTAADIFAEEFGLTAMSSSLYAAKRVLVPYFEANGIHYNTFEECYADRVNHRAVWYDQIKAYNTPDGSKLGRDLLGEYDIYVGVRNVEEFNAIKAAGLFDYAIWVDRSAHQPPEHVSSNTMNISMADYVLNNNGTLEDLRANVKEMYAKLKRLQEVSGHQAKPVRNPNSLDVLDNLRTCLRLDRTPLLSPRTDADLTARKVVGIGRYGDSLHSFNGRDVLLDLRQELLDAVMYSHQATMEGHRVAHVRRACLDAIQALDDLEQAHW